ncbi:hypothetical protein AX16_010562 [Volvariella volvacea WC 439]|nr:hypothetical protein AX16_010562 [Volvariella volvacea WC 439]
MTPSNSDFDASEGLGVLIEGHHVETTRTNIDEEISLLERRLLQLRRLRNTLAPISRLPEDVMLRIMSELPPAKSAPPQSWIQFTYVCRQWRTISINYPLLWTRFYIPHMSQSWIKTFIDRSRSAPLAINITDSSGPIYPVKTISLLRGVADRIVEFHCSSDVWEENLKQLDLSKAPLGGLKLHGCKRVYQSWTPTFSLQYLDLSRNRYDVAFISQSLLTLKLQDLDADNLPSVSSFYKTISSLTNLRHLVLQNVLTQVATKTIWRLPFLIPHFSIPSLQILELIDESEKECARFLSHASFPDLIRLYTHFDQGPTSLSLLNRELVNTWTKTRLVPVNPYGAHSQFSLIVDSKINRLKIISPDNANDTMTRIRWKSGIQSFCNLLATLPPDKLHSAEVIWKTPSEDDFLALISSLSKFPSLQNLRLTFYPKYWLYPAFLKSCIPPCNCTEATDKSSDEGIERSSSPTACGSCQSFAASCFPDLRYLRFRKPLNIKDVDQELLRRFLIHRTSCGRLLERMAIYYDKETQETDEEQALVQQLRGIVKEFRRADGKRLGLTVARV